MEILSSFTWGQLPLGSIFTSAFALGLMAFVVSGVRLWWHSAVGTANLLSGKSFDATIRQKWRTEFGRLLMQLALFASIFFVSFLLMDRFSA